MGIGKYIHQMVSYGSLDHISTVNDLDIILDLVEVLLMEIIIIIMPDNQEPKNEKGEAHGQWICYNSDGTIWFMDHNINGVVFGYCIFRERDIYNNVIYVKEYYAR
jgi:hypothetical protein